MRDPKDNVTGELVEPPKRGRGRPRKEGSLSGAERQAAYRARHQLVPVTVELPVELVEALNAYLKFKDETRNAVFARLIRSQLLRKR